ncbi:MAG: glycoside hydrolase family 3 C-terminal domain-containing protein [Bacteroidales bacterium]|nr:glycoside hydrolase family 3 C-terminal domain-containing protein [Bacteroidales bacterium]
MKLQSLAIGMATAAMAVSCTQIPQLTETNIDKVIAAMTLEEKAHLVVGTGMEGFSGESAVIGETKNIVPGAAGTTYPIPRLGIPAVVLADGPAGLRINPTRENDNATYYCTHFPIGTLLASTWDTALVEEVGKSIGNEVLEYGADVLLAPALNIHRNPLCGRNFEYYSEDPVVAGKIAAAYVRGVESNGVGTSIKHFAGNNQESNRTGNDSRVSQRALREIYLKNFEIVVKEANPMTVMSSYNYINGTYTSESKALQDDILRGEWGYTGVVMTDWFGGKDAVAQMNAHNDMLQPGTNQQFEDIVNGVKNGTLDQAVLDRNVKSILEMIVKTPHFRGYQYTNRPDLKAHAAVTRQSATDGMVLLENNGVLPLNSSIKNVALFGNTSYDWIAGGTGSGNVNRAYTVSLLDGLKNAGFKTNDNLQEKYEKHNAAEYAKYVPDPNDPLSAFMPAPRPEEMTINAAELMILAASNDAALITLGRTSGEFLDRLPSDFDLSEKELKLIKAVSTAFHALRKPVVVVLNVGGVIETASWKNIPDAILLAWQAGQEGGNSVADVLTGKASPSGKLPMTFPISFADAASSSNFPVKAHKVTFPAMTGATEATSENLWDYTVYEEDIYVGYRFFDSFGKKVSYPFGYGLSYTKFTYSEPSAQVAGGNVTVSVTVENSGKVAGKEVVEIYAKAPDAEAANKPEHELKGFAKTKSLQPGEKQTLTVTFPVESLASFDESASAWVVAAGKYEIQVGASSRDIRATLAIEAEASQKKVNNVLAPQVDIKRLTR